MSLEQSNVALLQERLQDPTGPAVVIDGGVGTSARDILEGEYGLKLEAGVWSATAQTSGYGAEILYQVHADFFRAGAAVAVANTFRTQENTFVEAGYSREEAVEATWLAIQTALRARDDQAPQGVVAASIAPIEDCYNPDGLLSEDQLYGLQYEHISHALDAGAEALFVETMPNIDEVRAALRVAQELEVPAIASFYYRDPRPGEEGLWLPNSERPQRLDDAAKIARDSGAIAVGVNCVRPSKGVAAVESLTKSGLGIPVGAWVQGYEPRSPEVDDVSVDTYDKHVVERCREIIRAGGSFVGGCCNVDANVISQLVGVAHHEAAATERNGL